MKKLIIVFLVILSISNLYSAEQPQEETNQEYKLPAIIFKTQLLGKLSVIKNELKNLANSSNSKFVRNFLSTIIEDFEKINIANYEELIQNLKKISKIFNDLKKINLLNLNELIKMNDIEKKINLIENSYIKNIGLSELIIDEQEQKIDETNTNQEKLNLNDVEIFTQEQYINLISFQQAKKLPYILARVETLQGMHYYDAHEFNKFIFNNYPIYPNKYKWRLEDQKIMQKKGLFGANQAYDPLNRAPLTINDIHYFTITSLNDNEFQYLASFNDLINNENLQKYFYKNNNFIQLKLLHTLAHDTIVNTVAITSNGKLIVAGDKGGTVKFWDAKTGEFISDFNANDEIQQVKISPDGQFVAMISNNFTIIFNLTLMQNYKLHQFSKLLALEFSPDSQSIAYSIKGNTEVKVINALTNELIYKFKDLDDTKLLEISPDGKMLLNGINDNGIKLIKLRDFLDGKAYINEDEKDMILEPDAYMSAISPNNELVVTASPAKIWDLNTGELLHNLDHISVVSIVISNDNNYVITGSYNGEIKIWNLNTGALLRKLKHENHLNSLIISKNNKFLVSEGKDVIKIWDIKTGKELNSLTYDAIINSIALSPDDKFLVIGADDNTVKVYEL